MGKLVAAALAFAGGVGSSQSWASTIVAPISAFATSNFGPTRNDYSIENTIDQSGLLPKYVSGVTDLEKYLALKPQHTSNANGNEWFSQDFSKTSESLSSRNTGQKLQGGEVRGKAKKSNESHKNQQVSDFGSANEKRSTDGASKKSKIPKSSVISANSSTSAITSSPLVSIIYQFSALTSINGLVLWNEEYAGIGTTQLLSSIDGEEYTLLSTITPKPSKFAQPGEIFPYLAQVFSFDLTTMLFFKLLIYDCPKPSANHDSYRGCGIGEVAFSSAPRPPSNIPPVPVPAALPLLGSALGIFAWLGRRQKKLN